MSIICLSGPPGSGKTSLAKAVCARRGASYGSFGDYVRHRAVERGLDSDRATLQRLGQELVSDDPLDFCRMSLAWFGRAVGRELVIDGLRHEHILNALIDIASPESVGLVYVTLSAQTQAARLRARDPETDLRLVRDDASEHDVQTVLRTRAQLLVSGEDGFDVTVTRIVDWMTRRN